MEVAPDFDEFIACLTAHGVEFVIVGAYALAFHGAPRFTSDLDVLIRPTVENAARLLHALEAFGFPLAGLTPESVADTRRNGASRERAPHGHLAGRQQQAEGEVPRGSLQTRVR